MFLIITISQLVPRPGNLGCAIILACTKQLSKSKMVIEYRNARDATPPTVGKMSHAGSESGRANRYHADAGMKRAINFDDYDTDDQGGNDAEDEDGEECDGSLVLKDGEEERLLPVSRVGKPHPFEVHNNDDESNDEEGEQCGALDERPPHRP